MAAPTSARPSIGGRRPGGPKEVYLRTRGTQTNISAIAEYSRCPGNGRRSALRADLLQFTVSAASDGQLGAEATVLETWETTLAGLPDEVLPAPEVMLYPWLGPAAQEGPLARRVS